MVQANEAMYQQQNESERGSKVTRKMILDTSVLIDDPEHVLYAFEENDVIISPAVISELNSLKDDTKRFLRSRAAADALKEIRNLTTEYFDYITEGIPLGDGLGKLYLEDKSFITEKVREMYGEQDVADNQIISLAYETMKTHGRDNIVLVSIDTGMLVKGHVLGIPSEPYKSGNSLESLSDMYEGYRTVDVDEEVIDEFKGNGKVPVWKVIHPDEVEPNEFMLMRTMYNESTIPGRVIEENGHQYVRKLLVTENTNIGGVYPKGIEQLMAADLLKDPDITFISLIGKSGTGKTYLTSAFGLDGIEKDEYRKILALRAEVAVDGKTKPALPGDLDDKLKPFMGSFFDNFEEIYRVNGKDITADEILEELGHKLEINSTAYMRGRTLPKQVVIVDEAQNLTRHEAKTILTRIGELAKVIFLGDPTQVDARNYLTELNNGLIFASETLKDTFMSGTVHLKNRGKRSDFAEYVAEKMNGNT